MPPGPVDPDGEGVLEGEVALDEPDWPGDAEASPDGVCELVAVEVTAGGEAAADVDEVAPGEVVADPDVEPLEGDVVEEGAPVEGPDVPAFWAPAGGTVGSAVAAGTVSAGSTTQVMGWLDNVLSRVSTREPGPIARAQAASRAPPRGPNNAASAGRVRGTSQVTGMGIRGVLPTKEIVVRQVRFETDPSNRVSSRGKLALLYPLGKAVAGMVRVNCCVAPAMRGPSVVPAR